MNLMNLMAKLFINKCIFVCLSAGLNLFLAAWLSECLPICLSSCLSVCLIACLPTCLSVSLLIYLLVCRIFLCILVFRYDWLPACIASRLSACLPFCLSCRMSVTGLLEQFTSQMETSFFHNFFREKRVSSDIFMKLEVKGKVGATLQGKCGVWDRFYVPESYCNSPLYIQGYEKIIRR